MDSLHEKMKFNEQVHEEDESENSLLNHEKEHQKNGPLEDNQDNICKIDVEVEKPKALIYRISENPPFHLALMFALQQSLLNIAAPLSVVMVVSEVACCQEDHALKIKILSATLFMTGLSTFMMSTFGVRLPVFQGPSSSYLIPLLAMQSIDEWKCPATYKAMDPTTNKTIIMAYVGNGTVVPNRDVSLAMLSKMSGSLMAAGAFHSLLGMTGLVGVIIRFIGPITIVPTILLVAIKLYLIIVKFASTDWTVAALVAGTNITMSLYLAKRLTPIPMWSRQKGFYIYWYPLHTVFAILVAMAIGWGVAAIFTAANYYSDDPESREFLARTDARTFTIFETNWFIYPYPGQFGTYSFSVGAFVNFTIATLLSVLDSIGDYSAAARVARVSPPPAFAFNRGLAVEGLMSTLSGSLGTCHATVSYGANIGAMGITKVASRRVYQLIGMVFITFAVFGKLGAAFISIPYSVLGGLMFVLIGILLGILLSLLQVIDLNSTRNTAIIGITLIGGFAIPYWVTSTPDGISTGNSGFDGTIKVMLSNPAFIGGFIACFLDNTVPGTLKERGLLAQMKDLDDKDAKELAKGYEDGPETYRIPFLPNSFRRSRMARLIPLFDLTEDPPKTMPDFMS